MDPTDLRPETIVALSMITDGPIPGLCSSLKLEIALAGIDRPEGFTPGELIWGKPIKATFLMRPSGIPHKFITNPALTAQRAWHEENGRPVGEVMRQAIAWLESYRNGSRLVPAVRLGTFEGAHALFYFKEHSLNYPFEDSQRRTPEELYNLSLAANVGQEVLRAPQDIYRPSGLDDIETLSQS